MDESKDRRPEGAKFHLRRGAVSFALYMLGEVVLGVYRYFLTAAFSWAQARYMLLRGLLAAALVMALCPLFARLFLGKRPIHSGKKTGGETLLKKRDRNHSQHVANNKLDVRRMLYLALGLVVVFVAIFARMDYMVRAQGDTYAETAAARSTKNIKLYGMRGHDLRREHGAARLRRGQLQRDLLPRSVAHFRGGSRRVHAGAADGDRAG